MFERYWFNRRIRFILVNRCVELLFESRGEAAFLVDEETGKIIDTNRCAEFAARARVAVMLATAVNGFDVLEKEI